MYNDKKIAVVMPAYNAEKTLLRTFDEICAQRIVDVVVVVDDCSRDATSDVPKTGVMAATRKAAIDWLSSMERTS